jgi:DNA repair protein RecO (recombination protein O)
MLIKSSVVVLSKLRYKDNDLIVRCYTKHRGTVSYLVKGALKPTKTARAKSVYFQPLSQLSIEENYKPNQSLQYFKDVKSNYIYRTLHTNIYKSAIVLFLSELLATVLREEEKNEDLFNYLQTALQYLDTEDDFANFHLLFLLKLSRYLGFQPEKPEEDAEFFNLKTGYFRSSTNEHQIICGKNLTLLKHFMGINFDGINSVKLNSTERLSFLNMLLYYFELHLEGFKKPKSLKVLNDVFH